MDDLINRQAVIDYVSKDNYYNGGWFEIEEDKYIEWLKALPSVQPTACIVKISFDDQQMKEMVDKAISNLDFSDLISKQAAINAIDGLYLDGESAQGFTADANGDCLIGKCKAIEILDDLPSVQPEMKVLEKIRTEIENITPKAKFQTGKTSIDVQMMIPQEKVLQIIDKYIAESEE